MRMWEDIVNAEVLVELDTELVRAENAELTRELDRTRAARDVLERIMTNALSAGAAQAFGTAVHD